MRARAFGEASAEAKGVIVGLGNPIMSDDAVGIRVARLIHENAPDDLDLAFIEAAVGGFELVEMLAGYDRAIVVDAIQTEEGRVGDYYLLDLAESMGAGLPAMTHHVGLFEGLELARRLKMNVPQYLRVYAIEVADPYSFGAEMTGPVTAAAPYIASAILATEYGVDAPCAPAVVNSSGDAR